MLPADWAAMQKRLYEVIRDEIALAGVDTVIWEQQRTADGALPPAPTIAYASLRVTSGPTTEGRPDVHTGEKNPTTAEETVESDERWTLTVQLHGRDDIEPAALTLKGALRSSDVLDRLRAVGVVLVEVLGPLNLDAIAGASFERRLALDLVLRSRARVTRANVGWIDPDASPGVSGVITQ